MPSIPKEYDPLRVEEKWQRKWEEWGIYRFRWEDRGSPTYVIDTPPPYPSGEFHMGTALNWTYQDIVARYKRMRGYNVFFPQGWDCHGLPTEVQVEKKYGIRKGDLDPEEFRRLCVELTKQNIAHMREEMKSLGFSIDWSTEYETMDPQYYGRTQLSFIKLYKKGLIYRGEHPVNWCPRCETAIADAEVEYESRRAKLYYIKFKLVGEEGYLIIATTRPEYLHACVVVAVHPGDGRYKRYVGKRLEVPLFGQAVRIIEDEEVDPHFGTGVVMVCTFGDKTDVRWVKRHSLPVIRAIDERGNLINAGRFSGLPIAEAKERIVQELRSRGMVEKEEELEQEVGVCWRCKTPVEILVKPQWFLKVLELNPEVLRRVEEVKWVPEHMKTRFIDWVRSMDWDWVISRQRIFATPIPAWYCKSCGQPVVAEEHQVPVIPWKDKPPVQACPKCGGRDFEPERDVLDTWMDSSITIACHAGWPDMDPRLFPADLQPNGTDIIRTWDYYLMVRHLALLGQVPYRTVLINGMVVGPDGRKMSKSLGNYVDTSEARKKHGADALRGWAVLGGATGSDVPFSWKEVEFCRKFMNKLWNAVRFACPHLRPVTPSDLQVPDRWILSRLQRLIQQVTEHLENFRFHDALKSLHKFVWEEFCDMYLEEVKFRIYRKQWAEACIYTLREVLLSVTKMLAPFYPHFAEEVYQVLGGGERSVHISRWPEAKPELVDERAEELGEILNSLVSALRKYKTERRLPLNHPIEEVQLYSVDPSPLRELMAHLQGTMNVRRVRLLRGRPELSERVVSVELDYRRAGPKFRELTGEISEQLRQLSVAQLADALKEGGITLRIRGREVTLAPEDLRIRREFETGGRPVRVYRFDKWDLTMLVPEKSPGS